MTLDGTQQLQAVVTANMGTVGTVIRTPENTGRIDPGETATTSPSAVGTGPPVYQATNYRGTLTATMGEVATEMRKITPETLRKMQDKYSSSLTHKSGTFGYLPQRSISETSN